MAWNNTQPYLKAQGAAVRVGILKIGKGNARCSITISKSMLSELGNPETCNVFIGDGDEAGQVMIECGEPGAHEVKELNKGGGKVVLNAFGGMPTAKLKPTGVKYELCDGEGGLKQITVSLPW